MALSRQSREYTMSQVKDLNAKLSRIGTTIDQPRHDLHASVSQKKVEVRDKPERVQEDDGDDGERRQSSKEGEREGGQYRPKRRGDQMGGQGYATEYHGQGWVSDRG
jgi:hypothetical protein